MPRQISVKQMTLFEALKEINANPSLLMTRYRKSPNSPLTKIFLSAFMPQFKWAFPAGNPPYRPCNYEAGMTPTDLQQAIRRGRLEYFLPNDNIKPMLREKIFIQLLESIDVNEAKVLIAVKDQCLEKMFPNITYENLAKAGYLPPRRPVKPMVKKEVETAPEPKSEEPIKEPVEEVAEVAKSEPVTPPEAEPVAAPKKTRKPRTRRTVRKVEAKAESEG